MQILYTIYLILLCGVLPLYMKDGYFELGEAKAVCYILISAPFAALLLLNLVFGKGGNRQGSSDAASNVTRVTASEFFLYGTVFSMILSFIFSVDKRTAFLGFQGWRSGLLVSLIAIVICFVFSQKEYRINSGILIALLIVPFCEAVLSILNRFSFFPFEINGQDMSFLATIGNINWFTGYLAIWVPLGVGIMYLQKASSWKFWVSGLYTVTGLVALFLQGSEGGMLILAGCYGLMLFWSLSERDSFKKFLMQLVVLGLAMTIVDVLLICMRYAYNYDNNILIILCELHVGIILMAAGFFGYSLCRLLEEIKVPFRSKVYKWIYAVALAALLVFGIVMLVIGYSDDLGNGRGIIYRMCLDMYLGLPSWQQLVGIGQDCIYPYAMADSMWSSSFRNIFGDIALTNAHCELLTILIERGMIGAFVYLGLFISTIYELFRAKEKEPKAIAFGLPVISYFLYDQISFSQVMSMPYCYVLLGMGMYLSKIRNRD